MIKIYLRLEGTLSVNIVFLHSELSYKQIIVTKLGIDLQE